MKILVTSTGKDMDSQVDMRFGRCPFFVLVEVEDKTIKGFSAVENIGASQAHGAGIMAAQKVGELGVTKIITGNLGPNAFRIIEQLGIESFSTESISVKSAVEMFLEGKLNKISGFGAPHQGMGKRQ